MHNIEKLSKQNKFISIKLFLSFIFFSVLLIVSIIAIHLYFSKEQKHIKFEREAAIQVEEKRVVFNNFFKQRKHSLYAISNSEYILEYAKNGVNKRFTELMFYTIMEENMQYMQLRFLDKFGNEKIRFNRDTIASNPYEAKKLQNKSDRYYLKETLALEKNRIWISELDLNMEFGKIQNPIVPVVRVAKPLFHDNNLQGILIVNIFMEDFLKQLTSSQIFDIYLVDKDGNFIIHKNEKYSWSKFKNNVFNLENEFKNKINIESLKTYKNRKIIDGKFMVQPLYLDNKNLYLILEEKHKSIKEIERTNNFMIITILIFSVIMSIIFSFVMSNPLKNIYKILLSQREDLEMFANNLEKKVLIETQKNAKKDRLLQHQSKLADLGDMIGNIAHQWRHPLTRLSLVLQNLKAYKDRGKMNDKVFEDSLKNSLYQIDFMSKTIDNFKDFYRKDEEKTNFTLQNCYDSVFNIIGSVLEHDNIKVELNSSDEVLIHANKNEFAQVLMNLIMNSKDAFIENNISDSLIKISISEGNKFIKIIFTDNAGGIKNIILGKVFEPYFTTKKENGNGIGLYLSKIIIEEKLKGSIIVRNYEGGVRFEILIPHFKLNVL